ncbi:MAG: YgdI/YgdR family lipoprotein [Syntrophales bacterium]|jgi:uncharacterized protein YceK|nr:YgdI/YgdR family lipoprotein [Syntrophales bacterium]MCK9390785.1 YgdI/YgdR family lipoprotein [Syntrophales bacterium]
MIRLVSLVVSCLILLAISGCGSYYKITEPTSKNVYYSTEFEKTKTGSIAFKDAKTGAIVTIQNSEIKEISRGTFDEEVKK